MGRTQKDLNSIGVFERFNPLESAEEGSTVSLGAPVFSGIYRSQKPLIRGSDSLTINWPC